MNDDKNYKDIYDIFNEPIGVGSFGTVFKAKVKNKEEYVAIKIINKEKIKRDLRQKYLTEDINDEYNKIENNLIKEVDCMKKCSVNNKNSIELYDIYKNEKEFIIVMELCDDNLMDLLIKKKEGFSLSEIYDILSQLNNAFKIMSENKIAHRDLKPQNILVRYNNKEKTDYTLKISDYGISKAYEDNANFETFTGTLEYTAPEILKGEKYNYQCDLWSLGIIIYMLHFKNSPFRGCSTQSSILLKVEKQGRKLFKNSGNSSFNDLIIGLLQKDPKKRLTWEKYFNHPFFKNKPKEVKTNKNDELSKSVNAEKVNLGAYENSYNDGSFWNKIKQVGKKVGIKPLYIALLLYYSLSKASILNKALIIGALGYFISPLDLIPDYIPILGLSDDAAVLMFAYYKIQNSIDDDIRDNAKNKLEEIFGDFDEDIIEGY